MTVRLAASLAPVGQVFRPVDVTGVVLFDDDLPVVHGLQTYPAVDAAVRVDLAEGPVAAVDVGACVAGVVQHPEHPAVGQPPPPQLTGPYSAVGAERERPVGEGLDHTERRTGPMEEREHIGNSRGNLLVRVDHGLLVDVPDVTDGERAAQLSTGRCGLFRPVQATGQQVQLGLTHRAFQSQQEAVVEVGQIVDTVAVDEKGVGQPGQLQ